MKIGVNCGHTVSGTTGCGAIGYIDESIETRVVGRKVMSLLKEMGHTVFDCTNDYAASVSSNLTQIVEMANKQPLDLFVSIHFNSGGGRGVEVFTYGGVQHNEAVNVCKNIESLGFKNRGVKDGSSLAVVRRSDAKSMLIEVCFVDTEDANEYKRIGADKFAKAICSGITGTSVQSKENEESGELDMSQYEELKKMIINNKAATDDVINQIGADIQTIIKTMGGTMVYGCIDKNMPEYAHEAVQWCMDKGIITGVDESNLNLNENKLWTCCVLYRLANLLSK